MMPIIRILYPIWPDGGCVGLTGARTFAACLCAQPETFINGMSDSRRFWQVAVIAVRPEQVHRVEQH